jgi:hypothetical protein
MALKKYKVISETYWDGVQLHPKGTEVQVETDDVQVAWDSRVLQPIGDSPVYENKLNKETNEVEKVVSKRKPKAGKAVVPPMPPVHSGPFATIPAPVPPTEQA